MKIIVGGRPFVVAPDLVDAVGDQHLPQEVSRITNEYGVLHRNAVREDKEATPAPRHKRCRVGGPDRGVGSLTRWVA